MPEIKPEYTKPQIVASYSKAELKEEFKELQGASGFSDAFVFDMGGFYEGPKFGDLIEDLAEKIKFPRLF